MDFSHWKRLGLSSGPREVTLKAKNPIAPQTPGRPNPLPGDQLRGAAGPPWKAWVEGHRAAGPGAGRAACAPSSRPPPGGLLVPGAHPQERALPEGSRHPDAVTCHPRLGAVCVALPRCLLGNPPHGVQPCPPALPSASARAVLLRAPRTGALKGVAHTGSLSTPQLPAQGFDKDATYKYSGAWSKVRRGALPGQPGAELRPSAAADPLVCENDSEQLRTTLNMLPLHLENERKFK